jgi:hypothetical protein
MARAGYDCCSKLHYDSGVDGSGRGDSQGIWSRFCAVEGDFRPSVFSLVSELALSGEASTSKRDHIIKDSTSLIVLFEDSWL